MWSGRVCLTRACGSLPCRFKPKLISKFSGNKVETKDDEDRGKRFEATLSRFDAKLRSARDKVVSKRGELDYNARNDKKVR